MQISPIPEFLKDYLCFTRSVITDPSHISYVFAVKPGIIAQKDNFGQHQDLVGFYQIMREMLGVMIYNNEDLFELFKGPISYSVYNERDIYDFPYKHEGVVDLKMVLDIPMYWYNPETEEIGVSIMPGGLFLNYSNNIKWTLFINIKFMLFTDHLEYRNTEHAYERRFLYFAPAARLNRELFRNFIKKVEEAYPNLEIDFYVSKFSTEPEPDKYGFPDKAESSRFYDED